MTVDPIHCRPEDLRAAVEWLRGGGIVALPTDTFYGLAVDPASSLAVRRLFDLKGRSARVALPFIASSSAQVEAFCGRFDAHSARLAERFWPGPLSLILDAPATIAVEVHGGRRSVAIRVPAHAVARALAEAWGSPLTSTSANRSGEAAVSTAEQLPPWTAADHVLIIDGGETPGGTASTIVDVRGSTPLLVRDGAIAWERVLESLHG